MESLTISEKKGRHFSTGYTKDYAKNCSEKLPAACYYYRETDLYCPAMNGVVESSSEASRLANEYSYPDNAVDKCSVTYNDTFHGQWLERSAMRRQSTWTNRT
ncbi:hypothetical protein AAVH_20563, partial [Aphelenchoides avenae]